MPEGLEVEIFRQGAARALGRVVDRVVVDSAQSLAVEIERDLPGRVLSSADRVGKHLVLGFSSVPETDTIELDVHFGMSGRLIVDGIPAIDELVYSSNRLDPLWNRLVIDFSPASGGGSLVVNDPRRWSRFVLEPAKLPKGIDLFDVTAEELSPRLARRSSSIKTALLDQDVVAGLGNMLVDEMLSAADLDPRRPAREVSADEIDRLVDQLDSRLPDMLAAGGSHTGLLDPQHRSSGETCPRCAGALRTESIGGRTTVWCPQHQR